MRQLNHYKNKLKGRGIIKFIWSEKVGDKWVPVKSFEDNNTVLTDTKTLLAQALVTGEFPEANRIQADMLPEGNGIDFLDISTHEPGISIISGGSLVDNVTWSAYWLNNTGQQQTISILYLRHTGTSDFDYLSYDAVPVELDPWQKLTVEWTYTANALVGGS